MELAHGLELASLVRKKTPPPVVVLPVDPAPEVVEPPRIGLALGGGFARGVAHVGVLKVIEEAGIPLHCITGVSAGGALAGPRSRRTRLSGCWRKWGRGA